MISRKILNVSSQSSERAAHRSRQYKIGKIFSKESPLPVDCIVQDASPSGNRLTILGPATLPDKFTLLNLFDGVEHRCKMVWRRRNVIGVEFI